MPKTLTTIPQLNLYKGNIENLPLSAISIYLNDSSFDEIQFLIEKGLFANRSEFIRFALNDFLEDARKEQEALSLSNFKTRINEVPDYENG